MVKKLYGFRFLGLIMFSNQLMLETNPNQIDANLKLLCEKNAGACI